MLNDTQAARLGTIVAAMFNMKPDKEGRYILGERYGSKTVEGIGRSIERECNNAACYSAVTQNSTKT